jgi:cytochrome P450
VAPTLRRDPLGYLTGLLREYGDVAWFKLGFDQVVMLNHPEDIKHVLTGNFENYPKSKFYCPVKPVLGGGIFLANGQEWLGQRRVVKPLFEGANFSEMAVKVAEAATDMLDRWDRVGSKPIDLADEMMHITLDSVARALIGIRLSEDFEAVHGALATVLQEIERRIWFPAIPPMAFDATNPRYRRALATLSGLVEQVLAERQANPREGDLLTALIDAYAEQRPALLRDQLMAMLTAGHETTALSLSWMFYLLSKHTDVARRVEAEVEEVLGGRTPTYEDLQNLTYCRMVFHEAIRLFPPLYAFSRQAVEDDEVRGMHIPKGTTIMVSPYVLHRHPGHWENPEGFDPERFRRKDHHAYAYLPFGGGPRRCIGDRFGTMEALLIMAMITQRYRIQLVPGAAVTPKPTITLRPANGIWVNLRRR